MKQYLTLTLYILLFTLLTACGSNPNSSPDSGAVTFNIKLSRPATAYQTAYLTGNDICIDYGVATVTAIVEDSSGKTVTSGSWSCSAHQGNINGIPSGNNYTVKLEGKDSDSTVIWSGEKTGISISRGETTSAGTIAMTYVGSDTTAPTVTSTSPADSAPTVPVTFLLTATFSEKMALSSINVSTFTVSNGSTSVSGSVTYDPDTMKSTFTPSGNLPYSTTYTAIITANVEDMAGNRMQADYSWSFTTEGWIGTKQWGTTVVDYGSGVAVDSNGNIFVTGFSQGNLDRNTNAGGDDIFLTKYNPLGEKKWTSLIGTSSEDRATGVAVDSIGNIYITGYTRGNLDGNTNLGIESAFLIKYDSSGSKIWTRLLGIVGGLAPSDAITIDSSGNVYIAGITSGGLDGNPYAGNDDIFLAKYDSGGNKQWSRLHGTGGYDRATGITVDSSGNVYISGVTTGDLGGSSNAGSYDPFIAKYNSSGTRLWTQLVGTPDYEYTYGIAVDNSGNTYVAGYTQGNIDGNINTGSNDIFLVKYDSLGNKQWTRMLGTPNSDYGMAVALDASENVYITGYTHGNLDGNLNEGNGDIFLAKYDSGGNKQWTRLYGTLVSDIAVGMTIDSNGIYLTGYTEGGLDGNTNAGSGDIFLINIDRNGMKR